LPPIILPDALIPSCYLSECTLLPMLTCNGSQWKFVNLRQT
jgi:hypothetical protein